MDQVRQVLRYHHYAYRTEQTYCDWIKRYIHYHGAKTHPRKMGKREIEAFLSHLAVQQNVAAATQRQALNAIVFLYKKVLDIPVDEKLDPVRAKKVPPSPGGHEPKGGLHCTGAYAGVASSHGETPLRWWSAAHGMHPLADSRS